MAWTEAESSSVPELAAKVAADRPRAEADSAAQQQQAAAFLASHGPHTDVTAGQKTGS